MSEEAGGVSEALIMKPPVVFMRLRGLYKKETATFVHNKFAGRFACNFIKCEGCC